MVWRVYSQEVNFDGCHSKFVEQLIVDIDLMLAGQPSRNSEYELQMYIDKKRTSPRGSVLAPVLTAAALEDRRRGSATPIAAVHRPRASPTTRISIT
jgi:hypothetical protein